MEYQCHSCARTGCFFNGSDMFKDDCEDYIAKEMHIPDSFVEKSNKYKDLLQEYNDYIQSSADVINMKDSELNKCYSDLSICNKDLNDLEKWKKTATSLMKEAARALMSPDCENMRSISINSISSFLNLFNIDDFGN